MIHLQVPCKNFTSSNTVQNPIIPSDFPHYSYWGVKVSTVTNAHVPNTQHLGWLDRHCSNMWQPYQVDQWTEEKPQGSHTSLFRKLVIWWHQYSWSQWEESQAAEQLSQYTEAHVLKCVHSGPYSVAVLIYSTTSFSGFSTLDRKL